jgi:hypothetical protein
VGWDWVRLVRRPLLGLLYQPRMISDDWAVVGGMKIGKRNRSTLRKPAPIPLCPPQIPNNLTWDRTRAAAVGSRRLTAWAMARPTGLSKCTEIPHTVIMAKDIFLRRYKSYLSLAYSCLFPSTTNLCQSRISNCIQFCETRIWFYMVYPRFSVRVQAERRR